MNIMKGCKQKENLLPNLKFNNERSQYFSDVSLRTYAPLLRRKRALTTNIIMRPFKLRMKDIYVLM